MFARTFTGPVRAFMALTICLSSLVFLPITPTAAKATCGAAAAATVYWSEGYDAQVVVRAGLNLRAGPGLDCAIVAGAPYGAPVVVIGESIWRDHHEWAPVSTYLGDGFVWTGGLGAAGSIVGPSSVPILMYHRINHYSAQYEITVNALYEQMNWLAANGYTSVTPSDLIAAIDYGVPLPPNPVMLTVDDGFVSTMTFAAVFSEFGFRGTYFIPNEAAGRLTYGDIGYLAQVGEVCGHTVDHANLSVLTPDDQWYEVYQNKLWLESITGRPVTCFAYPFGAYNWATTDIVASSGYSLGFNAWGGISPIAGVDRWHIPRIEVSGYMTLDQFVASL